VTATYNRSANFTTAKASGELQMVFADPQPSAGGNQFAAVGQVDPRGPLTIAGMTAASVTEIVAYAGTDEEFATASRRRVAFAFSQVDLVPE
jgi:hypothetical protein